MCTCASCKYTDDFRHKKFAAWPRGNPAGTASSTKAYKAHAAHCGLVMPRPWKYVSRPPVFSTAGLVMPVVPNHAAIRWNAGRG